MRGVSREPLGVIESAATRTRVAALKLFRDRTAAPIALGIAALLPTTIAYFATSNRDTVPTRSLVVDMNHGLIFLYLLVVAILIMRRPPVRRILTPTNVALGLLLSSYWLVGTLANLYEGYSFGQISFFLVPIVFVASVALRTTAERALSVLAWACVIVCSASLLLAMLRPNMAFMATIGPPPPLPFRRLAGVFMHANVLGPFAGIGVVLSWSRGWRWRLTALPICFITLVACQSRGSWAATALALSFLLVSTTRVARKVSSTLGSFVAVAATLVAFFSVGVVAFSQQKGVTFNGRADVWRFVAHHWTSSPFIGHGPGVWRSLIAKGTVATWVGQAHNQALETLYTTGLVGIILLTAILVFWTRRSIRLAAQGFWMPLALEAFIVSYSMLESPISPWGFTSILWILSLVVFLDEPVSDCGEVPSKSSPAERGRSTTAVLRSWLGFRERERDLRYLRTNSESLIRVVAGGLRRDRT